MFKTSLHVQKTGGVELFCSCLKQNNKIEIPKQPTKYYCPCFAQYLYRTLPKYYLLRQQFTVSPITKLKMLTIMRRSFQTKMAATQFAIALENRQLEMYYKDAVLKLGD